ncbi:DUF1127 domain-containing protein [Billgrantia pellis]|uniref:DUF1127 domain-containing protein n=1 Tax=Billgrantia pellis TaxID=2606936 RepID=A0A7V7FWT5_9GAMM|nr:DUF1127 domain-containing protein [Halomonas pellis]KAA0010229.1 DUF1127 domain-containing protein [Halomonas pellis]
MLFHSWRRLRDRWQYLRQRHHSRRRLVDLDQHLLDDVGLDRPTAQREARKPFWR